MTRLFARLLFRFLSRSGFVLGVADPVVAEGAVDETPPADTVATEGASDEADPTADPNKPKGDAPQDERDKLIRKLERRIDRRSHAIGARDATIAELQSEVARLKAGGAMPAAANDDDDDPQPQARERQVDPEKRARELAAEMLDGQSVATRTRAMIDAGTKLDAKWRDVAADVAAELPFVDDKGKPTPFIRAVLDADNPAALLHHIGTNDDVLESLQGLNAAQLGYRLGKIAAQLDTGKTPEPRRSNAPTPLTPLAGRGDTSRSEGNMTDDEWREARRLSRIKA